MQTCQQGFEFRENSGNVEVDSIGEFDAFFENQIEKEFFFV